MSLEYRRDIDGLRAVAVLPVVAFHVHPQAAPGGFVGVDVFFVISGFLITAIIRRELADGTFTLAGFYDRRIRRILPALLTVIAVSLAIAGLLFLPAHLRDAGQSAIAAILFSSNLLFWYETGYFDAAAYTKPLLHTWSLGIEEQFYIVVPLLLMALARLRLSAVVWVGLLAAASFLLSALSTGMLPGAAYYLLPWRAWELGVGALLALGAVPALPRTLRSPAVLAGLAAIGLAVALFDKGTTFPGVAALLPVLGTALVLHAGADGQTSGAARALGAAPLVWIGKRSYSLYLWHWPVVVFYTYLTLDMPGPWRALALVALAVALADLSFRFVETPFRRKRRRVFAGAAAAMATVGALALVPVLGGGLPDRLPAEAERMAAFAQDRHAMARSCERRQNGNDWSEPCVFGADAPASVVLFGDSHGPAFVPALETAGRAAGVAVEMLAHQGCVSMPDFQVFWLGEKHDCRPYTEATFERVLEDPQVELVIYVLRAQLYAHGWLQDDFAESRRNDLLVGPLAGPLPDGADRTDFLLARLESAIGRLRAAGKQVAIVYPLPEAGKPVPEAAARSLVRGGDVTALTVPREVYDARTARIIDGYDALVARHDLLAVRLDERLCDDKGCDLILDSVPLYRDTNHLTETAAVKLAEDFAPVLTSLGSKP